MHFKASGSPFRNIDSASKWSKVGDSIWLTAIEWERSRIQKITGQEIPFKYLIDDTDSLGFLIANAKHTEKAFNHYISQYHSSRFLEKAIRKRDSVAFQIARNENTYLAYKLFIEKYPDSRQSEDAKEIYELLLYETHTRDRNKASYENFISKFPHSPYLKEAEHRLFEIYSLDHNRSSIKAFLKKYPESFKADEARLWIKHMNLDYDSVSPSYFLPTKDGQNLRLYTQSASTSLIIDSVKDHNVCMPYYSRNFIYQSNDKWGMASFEGQGLIPAIFHDVVKLNNELYAYKNEEGYGLVHVSGFIVSKANYDSLSVISDSFVKGKKNGLWYLMAYNGLLLSEDGFLDIKVPMERILALNGSSGKWALVTSKDFLTWPPELNIKFSYDSILPNNEESVLLFKKDSLIISNLLLQIVAQYQADSIWEYDNDIQLKTNKGYELINRVGETLINSKSKIQVSDNAIVFKSDSGYSGQFFRDTIHQIDSFSYFKPYYYKIFRDSAISLVNNAGEIKINEFENIRITFYKHLDRDTLCFVVESDNKFGLLSADGDTILPLEFDEVRVFDSKSIRVKQNGKYGLRDFSNEIILRSEFDAITNYSEGGFTLFHNRRFGYIHPEKDIYLKAYQNNSLKLVPMKHPFFSEAKNDGVAFLDLNAKKKYVEINAYEVVNDSLIFLSENFQWELKKLVAPGVFEDIDLNCMSYNFWMDRKGDKHILFNTPTGTGFYDIKNNLKMYPEYSAILPQSDLNGALEFVMAYKYFEEINLYLVKLFDKAQNEIHKVLTTEEAIHKLNCLDE